MMMVTITTRYHNGTRESVVTTLDDAIHIAGGVLIDPMVKDFTIAPN
jgi:hypothetical protein